MLKTLEPMPSDRKCYRLIGGVLVQQTVAEVRPAVESNAENLKKVRLAPTNPALRCCCSRLQILHRLRTNFCTLSCEQLP